MPWAINGEIYPLWARSNCYALSTSFNWLFNFAISVSFLSLAEAVTRYGAFYIYLGISIFCWIFMYFMLPETGGRSLEEVENLFKLSRRHRLAIRKGESLTSQHPFSYNSFKGTKFESFSMESNAAVVPSAINEKHQDSKNNQQKY